MPPASEPEALGGCFGLAVRRLRDAQGWSQERLADRAGLNRSYVGEVERGAAMPSLITAARLARALGLALSDLIARSEQLSPPPAPLPVSDAAPPS